MKKYIPKIYHSIFPSFLLHSKLEESKAHCFDCNMSPIHKKKGISYKAHLKCCTFEPILPNYLLGEIFSTSSSDLKDILLNKIKKRNFSLPLAFLPSIKFQVEFNQRKSGDFGNREDWLCPYYNKAANNCLIWESRPSVCTTFYCYSSYGRQGILFWEKFNNYLTYVEMLLMEEVLVLMDFSPRQINELLALVNRKEASLKERKSHNLDPAQFKLYWNHYDENPVEFYLRSYKLVQKLTRKNFKELLGPMGLGLEVQLKESLNLILEVKSKE